MPIIDKEGFRLDRYQEEKISELYMQMLNPLLIYAKTVLQSAGLAEEAVQETFMIACQKPESLLASQNPKGWLVLTLKNVIRNQQRTKARLSKHIMDNAEYRDLVFENECATYDDYTSIEYSDMVSPQDFAMLRMYVFDKYSMLEISKEFGISVDAARKRIQRACKKLRVCEEKVQKI